SKSAREVEKAQQEYNRVAKQLEAAEFIKTFIDENDLNNLDTQSREYREKLNELLTEYRRLYEENVGKIDNRAWPYISNFIIDILAKDKSALDKYIDNYQNNLNEIQSSINR